MGRIYCIMGRSASGKDTVYRELKKRFPELSTYVMYTTRPMREGEIDGISYHFITDRELSEFEEKGRLIEKRVYHTVLGDWSYATVDDGQIELSHRDYLMLTTPEAFRGLKAYFGPEQVRDIYIEVDDGIRLIRAVEREMREKEPHYDEVCRRYLADCRDFSEEKLRESGIVRRYQNEDLEACVSQIAKDLEHDRI